ncbi:hypothetical protein BAE44_0005498 [Dichanthelium oligosanthes]|uniref:Transmembrane protein n=1 Tax=Dichanthelium oligosanthes TaxID=888268 RepID=A0A1E5W7U7_9POAL|nr:hypothetical protein BAE44_0005498 [Dichanthelium oligosanthes]
MADAKERGADADDVHGFMICASAASSALLSSAASLDSDPSSASSLCSSVSSSASVSGVLFPPLAVKRQASKGSTMSPAGVAAVVVCLLMVVFCGRVGATVLTSTALYLFPRRPARSTHEDCGVYSLLEGDAEEETAKRKRAMKLFMCFGGAAAVANDEAAAEVAAPHHRDHRGRSLSFREKFLSGKKGSKKKQSAASPLAESKERGLDADDVYGSVFGFGPSTASSVASSALLSSAASLDSGYSSSSSSSSSRSSSTSSSASVSGELFPPAAKRRANKGSSSAAGAAAVVLCLLMVVFCGRVGATLLTSMALYLFPRRWPTRTRGENAVDSLERDAAEETVARRKVVVDQGFLVRNRKK